MRGIMNNTKSYGTLYLVATPIGNYEDITLRAINILKSVDFVICEEFKEARRLLSHFQIDKPLYSINEHNEKENANDILLKMLAGESAALISDCGTPLFSDPGHLLVQLCISHSIKVVPIPGASSILPALTGSGFDFEKFYYYGWLSPKRDIRRQELMRLKTINEVIVIMDTPYRLRSLLLDIVKVFNPGIQAVIAFELTMKEEKFLRGSLGELQRMAEQQNLKGEFVLIINNKRR